MMDETVMLHGVDDTGRETWDCTLAEFLADNVDWVDETETAGLRALKVGDTFRMYGFVGCFADITRAEDGANGASPKGQREDHD